MRSVVSKYHGTASSLATTVEQYGNLFSVGIASAVFALTLGNVATQVCHFPQILQIVEEWNLTVPGI